MERSNIKRLEVLIDEKIELFAQYEKVTAGMLEIDIEDMLNLINDRQQIAHKIDGVEAEITEIYETDGSGSIKEAVRNVIDWGNCPEQLQEVYKKGQELNSCFTRISQLEVRISAYVEIQKEMLLKLIKEQNTGMSAKTARFYGSVMESDDTIKLFDAKC